MQAKQLLTHGTGSFLRLFFTWRRAAQFLCVFNLQVILIMLAFCLTGMKSHTKQLLWVPNQAKRELKKPSTKMDRTSHYYDFNYD